MLLIVLLMLDSHTMSCYGKTFIFLQNVTELSNPKAEEYCRSNGTLLPTYSDIVYSSSILDHLIHLNSTQSVWLSGSAVFSPFLISYGCFEMVDFGQATNFQEMSLFSCVKYCMSLGNGKIHTLGINKHICHCFSIPYYELSAVELSQCDIYCSSYTIDRCGGQSAMNVYAFDWEFKDYWADGEPSSKQCIYTSFLDYRISLHTASCYNTDNLSDNVSGYFCMVWNSNEVSHNCSATVARGNMCYIKDVTSWRQANDECLQRNGYMAHFWTAKFQTMAQNSRNYWLGRYRTFKAIEKGDGNVCLAITRHGDSFYIESDSCTANKSVLCIEPSISTQESETTPETVTTPGKETEIPVSRNITKQKPLFERYADLRQFWTLLLAIPSTAVLFIAVVSVMIWVVHRRWIRYKTQERYYSNAQHLQSHYYINAYTVNQDHHIYDQIHPSPAVFQEHREEPLSRDGDPPEYSVHPDSRESELYIMVTDL